MQQALSFTIEYGSVQRDLRTRCHIFMPFDPSNASKADYSNCRECNAIWDTGATGSVISSRLATELGLKPTGKTEIRNTGGPALVNKYMVNVGLPNEVLVSFVEVTEGNFDPSFDVLIGMDIISKGDFAISNQNKKTTFSFRLPSIQTIDLGKDYTQQSSSHSTEAIGTKKNIGRNDPCPCGSGKKYKKCHGK